MKTGGSSLDEAVEIADAVSNVLGSLDKNNDNTVKVEDISRFWISQGIYILSIT